MKRLGCLALIVMLIVAAGAGFVAFRLTMSYGEFPNGDVFVEIPPRSGVADIAQRLAAAGVVPDPYTFRLAAHLAHVDRRLEAGEYRFDSPATPGEVAQRLARGDIFTLPVTFPEGRTIDEMSGIFEKSGLGSAASFRQAAADPSLVADFDPDVPSLEGYLFPDTYAMPRHAGADGMVAAMVARFRKAFDADLRASAAASHLSVHDAVTIASLVETEAEQPDERPIIAAVFENRLRLGMPLQCDPTVAYALARAGRWTGTIHKLDLQIDSPYNTYRYGGLPPGPIASPGRSSLEAAVHPAAVPYLYFVSRNDGTHAFSTTLAEHNRNVLKYQIHRGR